MMVMIITVHNMVNYIKWLHTTSIPKDSNILLYPYLTVITEEHNIIKK